MSSTFGRALKISIFGESHGAATGGVADSFPAGEIVDMELLNKMMARRRPGQKHTTPRQESDAVEILSGVYQNKTTGTPLAVTIANTNCHSADYDNLKFVPRPGHADYAAQLRYNGFADRRGGGHFSGRLTAPIVALGAIAQQILARRNVFVGAHLASVWNIADANFDAVKLDRETLLAAGKKDFPVLDDNAKLLMQRAIEAAAIEGDSLGGVVECGVIGFPAGVGSPIFDRIECRLGEALFAIPAVRGVEFGNGFACTQLKGSTNNDAFIAGDPTLRTATNRHGGILGGISSGMPMIFRAAFKPTPSIAKAQKSVDLGTMRETTLAVEGRHDPCVAIRAVPVVEAMASLVLLDFLLGEKPEFLR